MCNAYHRNSNNDVTLGRVSDRFDLPWLQEEAYMSLFTTEELSKKLKMIKPDSKATTTTTTASPPTTTKVSSAEDLIGFGFFTTGQSQPYSSSYYNTYNASTPTWDQPAYPPDFKAPSGHQTDPILIERMANGDIVQCGSGIRNRQCSVYNSISEVWSDVGPPMTQVQKSTTSK